MSTEPTAFEMLRDFLSKPFVGPIISLIVLSVSLMSLAFAVAAYRRQGVRWESEDAKKLNVALQMYDTNSPEDMRLGRLEFSSQLPFRIRIETIQIVKPADALVSYVVRGNTYVAATPPAKTISVNDGQGFEDNLGAGFLAMVVKTKEARGADQQRGLVELIVTFAEVGGKQRLVRTASSVLPPFNSDR